MSNTLNYYRDYRPEGRIYAFCEDIGPEKEIIYCLWQKNHCIEKKKAYGDELIGFTIPGPGTLRISAHIDAATFNSGDIIIPAVAIPPSVRIVVTPIEITNDKMGTDRETNFTRT